MKTREDLIVVGVGASAGGLEAFSDLLRYLPPTTGMAFVLVQHLDPRHQSVLPELLSGKTQMQVVQAQNEGPVQPDYVYVIPPNMQLRMREGRLVLEARPATAEQFKPIDVFFCSLAEEFHFHSVGVVLSGTATDGTLGLKAIKAEGGITFAQDQSARFDSMPRSAMAAGVVDFVLSPRRIAEELVAIARWPKHLVGGEMHMTGDGPTLHRLLLLLRSHTDVDFTQYKQPTILRRVNRRMLVRKTESLESYLELLQRDSNEITALFEDLLINVTDFFRDPEVFEIVKQICFPAIVRNRKHPATIRAWIPGCSTGEEVYSLAIALMEFLESEDLGCTIQMFGTDVSEVTIERARAGIYSESAVANVSPERLRRFFVRTDCGYQISRQIRELCIFSRHNVAKDPPLPRMDLISCRNLLIYFSPSLQRRIIGTFSYALQPGGNLLLGPWETLGNLADYFTVLDGRHKIFCKKATDSPGAVHFSQFTVFSDPSDAAADRPPERSTFPELPPRPEGPGQGGHIRRYVDQIVLSRYGPPAIVVNESLQITECRGELPEYVDPMEMRPGAELMTALRQDLRAPVSTAIEQVRRTGGPVFIATKSLNPVSITVIPLYLAGIARHLLIVLGPPAEETGFPAVSQAAPPEAPMPPVSAEEENEQLKLELKATREYLQSVIEELRSTNEEAQSANEELQSTNEEMQTSKEELQASNEELNTINAELQSRNAELAQINDDLVNLLGSMNMPIVMTGRDLRIRRFTPVAEKALHLIASDIGRPIADLKPRINVPDLEAILQRVLESLQPYEREVQDQEGRFYLMRIRPYRTAEDRIDGTVLQLLDVSDLKRSLEEVRHARDYAEVIFNTIRQPLAVLDGTLVLRNANRAFYEMLEMPEGASLGKPILELARGRFDSPEMRRVFNRLKEGAELNDVEIVHKPEHGDLRFLLLNARRLQPLDGARLTLVAFEDITERKRAAEARYRRLFESARDGILLAEAATGEIIDLNPFTEYLLGYRREELVGRKLWEIGPTQGAPQIRTAVEQIRDQGLLRFDDLTLHTKSGADIQVEMIANLYTEGERRAIQFNMRDVTERKKFERELQETQKLESLGLLAGGIAHDFNNILTGILGNASLAFTDTPPDQPVRVFLRAIIDASERAALLTRQMLAYAGRGRIAIERLNLSELIQEISAFLRSSIPSSVELKLDLLPGLPPIEADPSQIQQVVMNLVINGAEAITGQAPGGGRVTVRTALREFNVQEAAGFFRTEQAAAGPYVQLEVVDNGAGMDDATRARIFDPFFTTKFTGRGLGLAAVQGIVRRHGGAIRVYSTPGQGTTFVILLPTTGRAATASMPGEPAALSIPAGSVALVIDDDASIRDLTSKALSRYQMKVLTAENGQAGLELFRQHSQLVSVVILDLQMPVMGGEETMALLRQINPEVPVILTSGFDESEAERRFSVLKPVRFLQKPYTVHRLIAAVAATLKRAE